LDPKKREFIELLKGSGWSQAEAARMLEMTRGGLNGIVTGNTIPSPATLKLFRLLLAERNAGAHGLELREQSPAYGRPAADPETVAHLLDELSKLQTQMKRVGDLTQKLRPSSSSTGHRAGGTEKRSPVDQVGDAIEDVARDGKSHPKP